MMLQKILIMKRVSTILFLAVITGLFSSAMIYRPGDILFIDTWHFYHDGTWYLYALKSDTWGVSDGFNVSTSKDGVHWEYSGRGIDWSEGTWWFGSGAIWKSPFFEKDGRFLCNFSEQPISMTPENICFGESRDLVNWKRLDLTFQADERWYIKSHSGEGRWDCIYAMPRSGGGYYGYWTATPRDFVGFGFGETDDGLHWKALPPPELDWGSHTPPELVEIGAVEKIGDHYYAMVGSNDYMVTFIADAPQGPFRASEKNFDLLKGDCYFTRFFPTPEGLLANYYLRGRIVREHAHGQVNYVAPIKRAMVDEEGTLRLGWWEGNNALKGMESMPVLNRSRMGNSKAPALVDGLLDIRKGTVLEGSISFEDLAQGATPGIWFETVDGPCAAIRILSSSETLGGVTGRDGSGFTDREMDRLEGWQHIDRDLPLQDEVSFRLLFRHSHIELYLDNYLFNVYSLPAPFTGRIGFMDDGAGIGDLMAWTMTLPDELPPRSTHFSAEEQP